MQQGRKIHSIRYKWKEYIYSILKPSRFLAIMAIMVQ